MIDPQLTEWIARDTSTPGCSMVPLYRELFLQMPQALCLAEAVVDRDGRLSDLICRHANPAIQRMTDRTVAEVTDQVMGQWLAEVVPEWLELAGGVLASGDSSSRIHHVEGLQRHLETAMFRVAPGWLALLISDVTSLKRAEDERQILPSLRAQQVSLELQNDDLRAIKEQLSELQAHYRELYDLAPIGYVVTSGHGLLCEANKTAADLLGWPRSMLLQQPLSRFIHPEGQANYAAHCQRLLDTAAPQTTELRMLREDGTDFWAQLASTLAHNETGALICRVVITDISERKQVEEALRQSERYARSQWSQAEAILEAIPANIALLDEYGTILRVNQAWKDFNAANHGRAETAGVGCNYLTVCDQVRGPQAEVAARFSAGIRSVIAGTSERFALEYDCHSPTEQRWFMGYVTGVHDAGAARAVVAHADVSQQKRAEEQVRVLNQELEERVGRRTRELQHTVQILQEEIGKRQQLEREILEISEREQCRLGQDLHDGIGQELAATAMMGQVLAKQLAAEQHRLALDAEQISSHIRNTIHSARALARGLYPYELNRLGLRLAILNLAEQTSQRAGMVCEVRRFDEIPQLARPAEIHLYRILQEAVANAVKHSNGHHIEIDGLATDAGYELTITDDGQGFTPDAAGSGMGIHLMQYRAGMIGAQLTIQHPANGGCRVICRLPVEPLTPGDPAQIP